MTEDKLLHSFAETLRELKEDPSDAFSPNLFADVIENNVPPWTSLTNFPTAAVALGQAEYGRINRDHQQVTIQMTVYVYNKYRVNGLSLPDILSYPISRVRAAANTVVDANILSSTVISSTRDNGTIHPYTVAELLVEVVMTQKVREAC